jgi:coatomer subunit beta
LAGTLTKLLLRLRKLQGHTPHRMVAEAMLFVAAILRLGESSQLSHPIDADSMDRMVNCLQACPASSVTQPTTFACVSL